MLKNVKIGTKLIGAFLLVAALTAASGVFAILKLRDVQVQYETSWKDNSRSLKDIGNATAAYQRLRVNVRDYVAAGNTEQERVALDKVNARLEEFQKAFEDFKATHLSDEEKELVARAEGSWAQYERLNNDIIDLRQRGKLQEANAAILKGTELTTTLTQQLENLVKAEDKISGVAQDAVASTAHSTIASLGWVILIVVAVAIACGIVMTLSITRPVREIAGAAQVLADGDVGQDVSYQSKDELGQMADAFRAMTKAIRENSAAAQKIAQGNLEVKVTPKSEHDVLGHALKKCLDVLNELMRQMDFMSKQHDAGDIDVKIEAQKFEGDYRKVAQGINDMVAGHITVKKKAMACLGEFGRGNFEAPLEKFPGKKAFINETIEQMRANLKALIADANMLVEAAISGRLATRADASKHHGDFRKIVDGVNQTLNAVIGPLNVAADYVDKISKGAIPAKITDNYNGDFNVIKNNLNNCIDNVNALVTDANKLVEAAIEGQLATRADASKHPGDFRKIVDGVNQTLNAIVGPLNIAIESLDRFAQGEAPETITADYRGEYKRLKDSINGVAQIVKARGEQVQYLLSAAAEGNLDARADVTKFSGGNAKLIGGINQLLEAMVTPIRDSAAVLDKLAAGDLTAEIQNQYKGEFNRLKQAINTVSIQVRNAMQQIGHSTSALVASSEELNRVSQQMSSSADETAAQANVVSAASDQVSKNVQTVATGADEMGASIKEIAKNTAEATKVAIAAVKTAESTNQTIEKLGQSSAEIGQVIKVITSIAQQTNLLALNATIEAARAGEAGKGFAVVANEVKELAKETAKATEDISQKIEAIQTDTKGAVSAIAQISAVINQINDIQNTIASAVEEQSATTNEISRNLAEAAKGAVDITKNIGGVAEAARSTTAGAVDTQKSAQSLERMSAELQELVSQFKYDDQKNGSAVRTSTVARSKPNGKYVAPVTETTYAEAVH